jgi:hypothetical protein
VSGGRSTRSRDHVPRTSRHPRLAYRYCLSPRDVTQAPHLGPPSLVISQVAAQQCVTPNAFRIYAATLVARQRNSQSLYPLRTSRSGTKRLILAGLSSSIGNNPAWYGMGVSYLLTVFAASAESHCRVTRPTIGRARRCRTFISSLLSAFATLQLRADVRVTVRRLADRYALKR